MKKFNLPFILFVVIASTLFGASVSSVAPSEMVLMGSFDDDDKDLDELFTKPKKDISQNQKNQEVETIVIKADEYIEEDNNQKIKPTGFGMNEQVKIALLVPKHVIGAYANSVSNSILSYLLYKSDKFIFEVFDSKTQSFEALSLALSKIKHKGYRFVIAPLTPDGANIVASIEKELLVFVPTVNIEDITVDNPNIIYGGIDYGSQIDSLLQYAESKIAIFGDTSFLAKKLSDFIHQKRVEDIVYSKEIKNIKTNFSYMLKNNKKLKDASIFLNMPVVKSALIASQLSRYKVPIKNILSTQVNYSPLLLSLTQYQDRENFYIANSIGKLPFTLEDTASLLGSNPRYNWIDYSSIVGIDYIFSTFLLSQSARVSLEEFYDNQVYYQTTIVKATEDGFVTAADAVLRN